VLMKRARFWSGPNLFPLQGQGTKSKWFILGCGKKNTVSTAALTFTERQTAMSSEGSMYAQAAKQGTHVSMKSAAEAIISAGRLMGGAQGARHMTTNESPFGKELMKPSSTDALIFRCSFCTMSFIYVNR
jgi:hypothetical protein